MPFRVFKTSSSNMQFLCWFCRQDHFLWAQNPASSDQLTTFIREENLWLNSPSRTPNWPGHASQTQQSSSSIVHLVYITQGKRKELSSMNCFYSSQGRIGHPGKCFWAKKSLRIKNVIFLNPGIEFSPSLFQTIEGMRLFPTDESLDHESQPFGICKYLRLFKEEMMIS